MRCSRVGLAACSLVLAACSSVVDPEGHVEVTVGPAAFGPLHDAAMVSSTISGSLDATGQITTPDPCREFDGRADVATGAVELIITSRRVGEGCVAALAVFPYRATVRGLQSGTYRVRVIHAHAGTGWPIRVVAETTASVR